MSNNNKTKKIPGIGGLVAGIKKEKSTKRTVAQINEITVGNKEGYAIIHNLPIPKIISILQMLKDQLVGDYAVEQTIAAQSATILHPKTGKPIIQDPGKN